MTLTEFLLARIAEDEAAAVAAQPGGWTAQGAGQVMLPAPWSRQPWQQNAVVHSPAATIGRQGQSDVDHIARWDPTRVLAECEAKRRIVEFHESWPVLVESKPELDQTDLRSTTLSMSRQIAWLTQQEYINRFGIEPPTAPMLLALAQPYADHPDYRQEWAA